MNTKKQGDVGLGKAIAFFSSMGWTVNLPLTDSQGYDLVIDSGKLHRVQVKTTTFKSKSGSYYVSLTVKGGNRSGTGKIKKFDFDLIDYVFVLTGDGTEYFIPTTCIDSKSCITLSKKFDVWRVNPVGLGG